jgi:hypothetical protein
VKSTKRFVVVRMSGKCRHCEHRERGYSLPVQSGLPVGSFGEVAYTCERCGREVIGFGEVAKVVHHSSASAPIGARAWPGAGVSRAR